MFTFYVNRDFVKEYIEIRNIIDSNHQLTHLHILKIDEFIYLVQLLQNCTWSVYHFNTRWKPRIMELQNLVNKYRAGKN